MLFCLEYSQPNGFGSKSWSGGTYFWFSQHERLRRRKRRLPKKGYFVLSAHLSSPCNCSWHVYNILSYIIFQQVMSAVFEPLKSGVRAFGNAVTAVPDTVYDGVSRVGDGINKAAKQIINFQPQQVYKILNTNWWCETTIVLVVTLIASYVYETVAN